MEKDIYKIIVDTGTSKKVISILAEQVGSLVASLGKVGETSLTIDGKGMLKSTEGFKTLTDQAKDLILSLKSFNSLPLNGEQKAFVLKDMLTKMNLLETGVKGVNKAFKDGHGADKMRHDHRYKYHTPYYKSHFDQINFHGSSNNHLH